MRGVGWVVLEAWSDEMVEGMAMDLVSRYISLFNRKHEKKFFLSNVVITNNFFLFFSSIFKSKD